MSADDHSRAGVVSRRAALVVAVGFSILCAVLVDRGGGLAVAGIAGIVVVGWGVDSVRESRNRRIAAGSVAIFVGGALAVAGVGVTLLYRSIGLALVQFGTFAVVVETFASPSDEVVERVKYTALSSDVVVIVALLVAAVGFTIFVTGAPEFVRYVLFEFSTANPVAAVVWLQVALLAVAVLASRARDAVQEWTTDDADVGDWDGMTGAFVESLRDVPYWYVAVLLVGFVLAVMPRVTGFVESFLAARPLLAGIVDVVVLSGYLHAATALVALFLGCVAVSVRAHRVLLHFLATARDDTPAAGAGGFAGIASAVVVATLSAAGVEEVSSLVSQGAGYPFFGPFMVSLIAAIAVVLVACGTVLALYEFLDRLSLPGSAFALGSVLFVVGTVWLAPDLPAAAVVVGSAVGLFVWDLGVYGRGLDADLHGIAASARTEVVHASATGLVLVGGILVAVGVGYLFVPLRVPSGRASAALALTLAAFVAFAFAVRQS